jgi:sec-independent protein translocase protein TatB
VFGVNPSEFIVLLVVAAVVLGPERLPEYAAQLARLVRGLRTMAQGASAQVRNELGPEFDEIDWAKLDPRQYDPRRIVREALSDVWDPDDPLGLKEGNRPRQPGDEDDFDGPGPRGSWDGEKPQSEGGPAAATAAARRARAGSNGGTGVSQPNDPNDPVDPVDPNDPVDDSVDAAEPQADGTPTPAPPAFDPDAT